jgi:hypothetical protein
MRWKLIIGVGLGMAVLAVAGSIAYANIPDGNSMIHGCYKSSGTSKGSLRVIDSDAGNTCATSEKILNWNQTGPQGPQGIQGPTGATGPQGPQGPSGTSVVYHTRNEGGVGLLNGGPEVQVASLSLTAGSYLVIVKSNVDVVSSGATRVTCFLRSSAGNFDNTTVAENGGQALMAVAQNPITLNASDTVSFDCSAVVGGAVLYSTSLTAIKLDTVVEQ